MSSSGVSDLATYVVVALPQSINIIYGWLTAIPQQVYCQDMESRSLSPPTSNLKQLRFRWAFVLLPSPQGQERSRDI